MIYGLHILNMDTLEHGTVLWVFSDFIYVSLVGLNGQVEGLIERWPYHKCQVEPDATE